MTTPRQRVICWCIAALGLGCGLARDNDDAGSSDCAPGTEDCVCAEQGCIGDLVCEDGQCIGPDAGDANGGPGTGSSDSTDDGGTPQSPSSPVIVDFGSNVTQLTEGESAVFTATVIDPDGPDDIQGGSLKSEDGAITYGGFEDIGNGTFELTISWDDLHLASAIEFTDDDSRALRADFFDNSGNMDSQTSTLALYCDEGDQGRACDGQCVSLWDDADNCGACGTTCEDGPCVGGTCSFAFSPCLESARNQVESCAEYCGAIGELCAGQCGPFGRAVSLWSEPGCLGNPDFSESDELACTAAAPPGFESAMCCCTVDAQFP